MSHVQSRVGSDLLFAWVKPRPLLVVLPGFVVLSFLAHAATFVLFTVVYPHRVTIPPAPPRVALLTSGTPEGQAMLRWLEAEDPALGATTTSALPDELLEAPYQPSFLTPRTAPRKAAEQPNWVQYPAAKPPLAFIRSDSQSSVTEPPSARVRPTTVRFAAALSSRPLVAPSVVRWPRKSAALLQPAQFLVGVEATGKVAYVLPQKSSGDSTIDEAAAAHLSSLAFTPAETPLSWGFATLLWGDDVYEAPDSRSHSAPAE